jgi:hypothetical protein
VGPGDPPWYQKLSAAVREANACGRKLLLDPPAIVLSEERWESEVGATVSLLLVRRSRLVAFLEALSEARLPYEVVSS